MAIDRRTIAEGITRDRYSLTARVQVGDRRVEKAFPQGTPIKEMQDWRDATRVQLRAEMPIVVKGSIEAETPSYLERAKKRPASWKSKRSEMAAWNDTPIGRLRRHRVTAGDVDLVIAAWVKDRVALKTIVNRCRTLHHFYVTMANDKRARTPLDNVDVPKPPKRRPAFVDAKTIMRVEKKLRRGDPKTRARFMVIAATGIRPSQLARLTSADVDVKKGLVLIEGGKGGEPIAHVLNDDMHAAWRVFIAAGAWGAFDVTKFARDVRAAGWPSGVRVYNAKHSFGIELAEAGADARDIQAWFGHTDDSTTKIYTGVPLARMRRLSETLSGRFGWKNIPRTLPRTDGHKRSQETKTGEKLTGTISRRKRDKPLAHRAKTA